ncbi:mechanosensitive ion channel domain-containing protein [Marivita sp. GX14005]|uniref:mechanosensitive ion channel family protein n=1 Tax=Marivita sp. GX14005 TaxID=2942276 RepID=UPI002018FBD8|nr:mechanosensitive ion channel domain-containing protein [Marivita sp. GX14005]MCL3881296.1 mechanosensitive ion channel family protein [Marivita sp. GX14005]
MSFTFKGFCIVLLSVFLSVLTPADAQEAVYEIERLNAGLGSAPEELDRSSPHSSMEALLDLVEADDLGTAAHLLNLAPIPPEAQPTRGPQLARKLHTILDRKIVIDWGKLLDRPDALDASQTTKSAVAGQARQSILLGLLTIDDRPYPIRLDRVQAGDQPPVWVFSERTVADIEKLYHRFGPTEFERALPDWMRHDAFWNLMWWEVIGVPIMFVIAGLAGWIVHSAFSRLARRTKRYYLTRIIEAARLPAVLFTITLLVSLISNVFVFSGPIAALVFPAIALGYVMSALIFLVNAADRVIDQIVEWDDQSLAEMGKDSRRATATRVSLARRMMIVVIFLVGIGVVLAEANVFRTFGFSLLASAGALTLILGFAAREVLSNIMSSMQIALNQSARIGDKVIYKGQMCNVERINFTFVLLRVWTGVRLVVPVTEFVSETFENWTMREPQMIREIAIRVAHCADVDKLRQLFDEVVEELDDEELYEDGFFETVVTSQDVFGQVVTFCLNCSNPNTSWMTSCKAREMLIAKMQKLEEQGERVFPEVEPAEGA